MKSSVEWSQVAAFRPSRHHFLDQQHADLVVICGDLSGGLRGTSRPLRNFASLRETSLYVRRLVMLRFRAKMQSSAKMQDPTAEPRRALIFRQGDDRCTHLRTAPSHAAGS